MDQLQEKLDLLVDEVLDEAEFIGDNTYGGKMEDMLDGDALGGSSDNEGGSRSEMPVYVDVGEGEDLVDSAEDVLKAAKDAIDTALDGGKNKFVEVELGNESELIGFLDDHAEQVALAFPWLFPLGLESSLMKFNDEEMNWLLNQYDQRMALCAGMWKNNSKVLEGLQERIDKELYEEIEECLKFPDSDGAKKLARELEKMLSSTVISSPYSNGANKRALTAMMAMNRYFGPRHAYFITVNYGEQLQHSTTGEAASLLMRALNAQLKVAEFSTVQMISGMIGNSQYQSSHVYNNVWIRPAMDLYNNTFKKDQDIFEEMQVHEIDFTTPTEPVSFFLESDEDDGSRLTAKSQCYDYMFRGPDFAQYSYLEYVCLVRKVPIRHAGPLKFKFAKDHKDYKTHVQVLKQQQGIPILC
ncbi:hypothetical protein HDU76_008884, partial [Blyttiomyces sp. JEL0837]